MSTTVYKKSAITGGGATALDGIDGAGLLDSDMAFVTLSGVLYVYILDADDAGVEASPTRITPDANAGDKRWLLQDAYLMNVTASAAELNLADGSVAGTAVASKLLCLGADKNIDTIAIAASGLKIGAGAGTAVTADAAELNLLDGSVAGTAVASKALALGANKNVDTLVIADGGLKLGAGAGTAVTSSAAELNVLDGIPGTLTATELGYVDGVTSAIQTQLDAKNTITEVTAASLINVTTTVTWTDVDITAYRTGGVAAKFAILKCAVTAGPVPSASASMEMLFRKNGTTNTFARLYANLTSGGDSWSSTDTAMIIVPLDGDEIFEYSTTVSTAGTAIASIVGFIT